MIEKADATTYTFTMNDILSILPHRNPFLFVDEVTKLVPDKLIVTERLIRADEFFFKGHFPGLAIMPGVLINDALAQTSGLLWGLSRKINRPADSGADPEIFFLAASNMKYTHPSHPGDTLIMTAHAGRSFGALFTYDVEARVGRNKVAGGTLTLAMKENL